MKVATAKATSTGNVRENNEDSFLVVTRRRFGRDQHLLVVADGMGGREAGEVASSNTVAVLGAFFKKSFRSAKGFLGWSIHKANHRVHTLSCGPKGKRGMGTTCTAMVLSDRKFYLGHVGDSRAYLLRGDTLYQLTEDQTMVTHLLKTGQITQAEAHHHPHSHVLTQALGTRPKIEPELWLDGAVLVHGDRFLLCSDGLYNEVTDEEMQEMLQWYPLDESAALLMELALSRQGLDNVTVVVAEVSLTH